MKFNWWKIGVLVAAVVALFLWGYSCGKGALGRRVESDTTVRKDSLVFRYKPTPYKVVQMDTQWLASKPIIIHDTTPGAITTITESVDSTAILRDYFATRFYDTTFTLKRGTIRRKDTVSMNRIVGTGMIAKFTDTTIIKKEIVVQPRRIVGSVRITNIGNATNLLFAQGASFDLKLPNNHTYGIGAFLVPNHKPMVQLSMGFPIRLNLFPKRKN